MNGNDGQTTGDARVDAALARFDELAEAPLTTHPEIFEDVHRRLQDALTGIEQTPPRAQAPAGPGVTGETRERNEIASSEAEARAGLGRVRDLPGDAEGDAGGWPER